jgi:Spy/CpxP family protein refolding chaperone
VDEAAVYAQQDVLSALKNESRRLNLATMLQVRALLTPEQREQLRPRHHSPPGE